MSFDAASDPSSWSWLGSLNTNATIVLVALIPQLTILLIYRGSDKLGIIGIGTAIKTSLDYAIALLEHHVGQPPKHPDERAPHVAEAKASRPGRSPQTTPKA
jgi:hypothetical protein